jgi:hypothetical protein
MAWLPCFFLPDCPQHVIQRGNNGQATFAAMLYQRLAARPLAKTSRAEETATGNYRCAFSSFLRIR